MTGMKEGAGDDPFAEDEDSEVTTPARDDEGPTVAVESEPDPETATERTSDTRRDVDRQDSEPDVGTRTVQASSIPYKQRRDSVHDGRDRVPLFLLNDTNRDIREAKVEMEDRFDTTIHMTDVREALIIAGLKHRYEAEKQLEQWGYGLEFE